MMYKKKSQILLSCLFLSSLSPLLVAHHNGSKYFPFLEKTEEVVTKKKQMLSGEYIHAAASGSYKRGGARSSLFDLWGSYDLQDIFSNVEKVYGATTLNPIKNILPADLQDRSIPFKVNGKSTIKGITLSYHRPLPWYNLSIGAWLPVVHAATTACFDIAFNDNNSIEGVYRPLAQVYDYDRIPNQEGLLLDVTRRAAHTQMGITDNHWEKTGFGDLDAHLTWNYVADHKLLVKSIDSSIRGGVLFPTGITKKASDSFSIPTMGDGHWGAYLDILPEFELRQDWKLGFLVSGLHQFKKTKTMRIPTGKEPAPFSGLIGKVEVDPGFTLKISPYFTLEHVADGVHLQLRYTYLRHNKDSLKDKREDKTIESFLTTEHKDTQENLLKWRSHFLTFQVLYDTQQARKKWPLKPMFFVTYDAPIGGNGIARTYQLSLGTRLFF